MSAANKLWWECERKSVFPNETHATRAAERIRSNPRYRKNERMIAFKCKHGDHWHVGHVRADSRQWQAMQEDTAQT
jgi:hypothetical protein